MKQRVLFVLAALWALYPVSAQERVFDYAGVFSGEEKAELEDRIASVSARYGFGLVIVFDRSLQGYDINRRAADFYETGGFPPDGAILFNAVEDREFAILASGKGKDILNPAAFGRTSGGVAGALGKDRPLAAARLFCDEWDHYLALDARGRHYNAVLRYGSALTGAGWILGLLVSFLTVMGWKAGMKTAVPRGGAAGFTAPGGPSVTEKNDSFLYSAVSKTPRQSAPGAKTGGSGPGAVRASSSGKTYSGGSRKY
ncbi:MAG: TPM domain-containing protein [Spirochaetaceae bacterium]|jgi:uncharacterized protein|nr:TPM domain-containing protein [Spirochaetaceae bacterium]